MFNSSFGSIGGGFVGNIAGMQKSFLDRPDLIAADVLVPSMKPGEYGNVNQNFPQLPERGVKYRAFGNFGSLLPEGSPGRQMGFPTEIQRGLIRGEMNFVPGGIPANPNFNYEETLKQFPEQMKGIKQGYMPVYY